MARKRRKRRLKKEKHPETIPPGFELLHTLRGAAPKRSRWRTATFETIRRAFLKIAVRVEQLKTRIRLSLPSACPHAPMIALMLGRIHAQSP